MNFFCCQVSQSTLNSKGSEFVGFSIGYIQFITSELTDNQISSSCLVQTFLCRYIQFVISNEKILSLIIPSQLCHVRYPWIDRFQISSLVK